MNFKGKYKLSLKTTASSIGTSSTISIKSMAGWQEIPPELFEKLASELYKTSQVSFYNLTIVCSRWRKLALNELSKYIRYNSVFHRNSYWLRMGSKLDNNEKDSFYEDYFRSVAATTKIFDLITKLKINLSFYKLLTSKWFYLASFTCFYMEDYGQDFLFWYDDEVITQNLKIQPESKFSPNGEILMKVFNTDSSTLNYIRLNSKSTIVPTDIEGIEFPEFAGLSPFNEEEYQTLPKPKLPAFKKSSHTICFYDMKAIAKPESQMKFTRRVPKRLPIISFMNFTEQVTYYSLSIDNNYLAVVFYGLVKIYRLNSFGEAAITSNPLNNNSSKLIYSKQYPSKVTYLGLTSNAQVLFVRAERLAGLLMVNLLTNEENDFGHYTLGLSMNLQNDHTLILSGFGESFVYGLAKYNSIHRTEKSNLKFPSFNEENTVDENKRSTRQQKRRKLTASNTNKTWDYFISCADDPIMFAGKEFTQLENGASYLQVEKGQVSIQVNVKFAKGKFFKKYRDSFLGYEYDNGGEIGEISQLERFRVADYYPSKKSTMPSFFRVDKYSTEDESDYGSEVQSGYMNGGIYSRNQGRNVGGDDDVSDSDEIDVEETDERDDFEILNEDTDSNVSSSSDHSDSEFSNSEDHERGSSAESAYFARGISGYNADSDIELEEDHHRYVKRDIFSFDPSSQFAYSVSESGRRAVILINDILYVLNTSWQAVRLLNDFIEHYKLAEDILASQYPFPINAPFKVLKHKSNKYRHAVKWNEFFGKQQWFLKCKIKLKNMTFMNESPNITIIGDERVVVNYNNGQCYFYDIERKSMAPLFNEPDLRS